MTLEIVIAGIIGLVFGSFGNVLIARYDRLDTIATTRSECPHCQHLLAWYDLVPVLSFLCLAGKCRYCRKPISWQYPIVELIATFLAIQSYLRFGASLTAAAYFAVFLLLLAIAIIDLCFFVIPDAYVFPALMLAFLLSFLVVDPQIIQPAWGVLLTGGSLLLMVLVSNERWMGAGDVGLGVLMGLLGGLRGGFVGLVLAFVVGSLVGLVLIALKRKSMKDMVPFGPFLALATYVAALWGNQIMNAYLAWIRFY